MEFPEPAVEAVAVQETIQVTNCLRDKVDLV
jgi:hypothetical protein